MESARLSKYQSALFEMRQRLIPEISHVEDDIREDAFPPGELSRAPTHMGNITSADPDRNIGLAQNEQAILEQVEAALQRIEAGTYGRCEDCGQEVSRERLDAIPYTPVCIHCAQQRENAP